MSEKKVSRRGVFYDLKQSPYEYVTPCGDCLKFASQKKLEMFTRDVTKEIERMESFLMTRGYHLMLSDESLMELYRVVYLAFYRQKFSS